MLPIDLETAIAHFLALGRRLLETPSLTGERVLSELTAWYRDTRVEGAAVERDDDMLLFQWGAMRPLLVSVPTDLRHVTDIDLKFAEQAVRYLDFTRQVFALNGGEDFDDSAVQMSITLGFGLADGCEPLSNTWVPTPAGIDKGKAELWGTPFAQSLLSLPPQLSPSRSGTVDDFTFPKSMGPIFIAA